MVAQEKRTEMPEQMMLRLARKAREEGCRLFVESSTEETFITSGTMDGVCYHVTRDACTCKGFEVYRRCKHHSLLLLRTGVIVEPEPDPEHHAALLAARAELAHLEGLQVRNKLKTTADFMNLNAARQRVDELAAAQVFPVVSRIGQSVAYAAD